MTMSMEMNTGSLSTFINKNASIIKETTGTALITRIAGAKTVLAALDAKVNMPKASPKAEPKTNPQNILSSVLPAFL